MTPLKSLSIKFKILLIPVVGAVGFSIYLITSLLAMSQIVKQLEHAHEVEYQLLQTSEFALVQLDKIKDNLGNAVTTGESEILDTANKNAEELRVKFKQTIDQNQSSTATLNALLEEFNAYYVDAFEISKGMVDGSVDFNTLADRSAAMTERLNLLQANLNKFQATTFKSFNYAFESVNEKVEDTSTLGIIIGIVTILLLFAVALPIATTICRSLSNVIASLKNIAQENGDLTVRLQTTSKDEIGDLVFWFNSFIEKLQGVIKDVVETAVPLAQTANNIQTLSDQTLSSFKRQQDSVALSRDSVKEMNLSVADITANAADAVSFAHNANSESIKGKQIVEQTVTEIRQLAKVIAESSEIVNQLQQDTQKVNVVLEVIRGIADQTNLLALNAAIEAARAGEQGRGFAVVADEVRNLASRTQESTEEINLMLAQLQGAASKAVTTMESSTAGVEASVESANAAGESLTEITSAISVIVGMNDAIAATTEEQHQVSNLMVNHVEEIETCASEAADASNKIADVSDHLAGLASELESIALKFKV